MQNNVKTSQEIAYMRKAASITDDVFDSVLASLKVGITEKEIADLIFSEHLRLGASGVSFDTIVAFGENGAEPHHVPTDKPLERGMLVTIDMGAVYEGYDSDFTRTVAFGEPSQRQREIYEIVLEAQRRGLAAVKDGIPCKTADAATRGYIEGQGYGQFYIHGTGHGVGTEIHELPTLNSRSEEVLIDGQVVTVEPGIYITGELGVRIEDMVLVGEGKPFSRHMTELIIL